MGQKEALLHGDKWLEPVDLSSLKGPAEVLVRPLTSPETARVMSIQHGGISSSVDPDLASPEPFAFVFAGPSPFG